MELLLNSTLLMSDKDHASHNQLSDHAVKLTHTRLNTSLRLLILKFRLIIKFSVPLSKKFSLLISVI